MQRPSGLHQLIIDKAFEAGDKQTVIDAYLDVLNYKTELMDGAFVKVLESLSSSEAIDHVLLGHVKEQMDLRGLDSKVQMSVWCFNINGELIAADLLNDLDREENVKKVSNSSLFKILLKLDILPFLINSDFSLLSFANS